MPDAAVTVVIPTRDRDTVLRRALDSVLAQSLPAARIVVVDDAGRSGDTGALVAQRCGPLAEVIVNDGPCGPAAARNQGWERADTPFLAFLNSDDVWDRDHLANQVARLTITGAVLTAAAARTGQAVAGPLLHRPTRRDLLGLASGSWLTSGFVLRTALLHRGARFDTGLPALEDLDLAIQAAGFGLVLGDPRPGFTKTIDAGDHVGADATMACAYPLLRAKYRNEPGFGHLAAHLLELRHRLATDGGLLHRLGADHAARAILAAQRVVHVVHREPGALGRVMAPRRRAAQRRPVPPTATDDAGAPRPEPAGRPLQVMAVIKGLGLGGAERLLVSLATAVSSDIHLEVISTDAAANDLAGELADAGVPVRALDGRALAWIAGLAKLVRTNPPPDIVHVHSPLPAVVVRILLRSLPQHRRPLLITTEHGLASAYHPLTRQANRMTLWADDHRIAVSQAVQRSLPPRHARRTEVLHHGIDRPRILQAAARADQIRAELAITPETVLVACVGRLRAEKDHTTLLSAAALLRERCPDTRIVLVGDGPLRASLEARHAALGLGESVRFLGARSDAVAVIAAADVLCLSSRQEGLPLTVMEALVLGKPVVATRVGGIPELITDGVEGLLSPAGDAAGLARALASVTTDSERRAVLGAAAERRGAQLDARRAAAHLEERYRQLAAARRRRR